jgi:hypothetical protein
LAFHFSSYSSQLIFHSRFSTTSATILIIDQPAAAVSILQLICASFSSLCIHSSLGLLNLCHLSFLLSSFALPVSLNRYTINIYKSNIYKNAQLYSSSSAHSFHLGLNLTHAFSQLQDNVASLAGLHTFATHLYSGINLHTTGRLQGSDQSKQSSFLQGSFNNRILDISHTCVISAHGSLGVIVYIAQLICRKIGFICSEGPAA